MGYYQDKDESMESILDPDSFKDEEDYYHPNDYLTFYEYRGKAGLKERDKRRFEKRREFEIKRQNGEFDNLPKTKVIVYCKNEWCKSGFIAKKADRKRGWAKFCSKSCKAQHQQQKRK